MIPSDSIFTYRIDPDTGALNLVESAAAVGSVPRHFSLNAQGDMIAIVSQRNGWVSIFERDITTGKIGKMLATQGGFGALNDLGPVCVLWDTLRS